MTMSGHKSPCFVKAMQVGGCAACQSLEFLLIELYWLVCAGTITNAAKVLHAEGAREVYACATHAVFSPPAVERLSSGVFQEVIVTNTIPVPQEKSFPELTVLSVANLLGETIWRVYNSSSVQSLL